MVGAALSLSRLLRSETEHFMTWYTPMKQLPGAVAPIRRQIKDTLLRARQLPVGPHRNDLRQLANGLRWLEKHGGDERVQELVRSHTSKRRPDHYNQAEPLRHPGSDLEEQAVMALERARAMPYGPDRSKAVRRARDLRNAADLLNVAFARRKRLPTF
jgi:hypothetical protein